MCQNFYLFVFFNLYLIFLILQHDELFWFLWLFCKDTIFNFVFWFIGEVLIYFWNRISIYRITIHSGYHIRVVKQKPIKLMMLGYTCSYNFIHTLYIQGDSLQSVQISRRGRLPKDESVSDNNVGSETPPSYASVLKKRSELKKIIFFIKT